jgi:hypothetical protein
MLSRKAGVDLIAPAPKWQSRGHRPHVPKVFNREYTRRGETHCLNIENRVSDALLSPDH